MEVQWFESYLLSRYQCVKINQSVSQLLPVISGVPQGSILGPLLYINDLPCCLSATTPFMFADDTKIVLKLNGLEDEKLLQDDIQALSNWSHDWSLQFSPSKCGLLRFWNDYYSLYNEQCRNCTKFFNQRPL